MLSIIMAEAVSRGDLFSPRPMPVTTKTLCPSFPKCSLPESSFRGSKLVVKDVGGRPSNGVCHASTIQMGLSIGKSMRWWEKGLQTNMFEITSARDLVDRLENAGDQLVIVDFFSPGCGGCKALHPKICQFAENNPDVQFLQVNYEEQKSMACSLNVHVLPFFRFYRGAHGKLCSFSCTNATIKKFRDALAKHGTDRCSLGPTKGLEEKELLALAANRELGFIYTKKPEVEDTPNVVPGTAAPPTPRIPLSRDAEERKIPAGVGR